LKELENVLGELRSSTGTDREIEVVDTANRGVRYRQERVRATAKKRKTATES